MNEWYVEMRGKLKDLTEMYEIRKKTITYFNGKNKLYLYQICIKLRDFRFFSVFLWMEMKLLIS
jgi:hypothetical protein